MKQAKLQGFGSYTINEDGTILDANGKTVKPNKAGLVKLTCDENVGNFNAGQKYEYEPAALVAAIGDGFVETAQESGDFDPNAGSTQIETKVLTEEEQAKKAAREAKKAERKALEKVLSDATTRMVDALTVEETMAAKGEMVAAKEALTAWDEANKHTPAEKKSVELTPEQVALLDAHKNAVAATDDAKSFYEHCKTELAVIAENCRAAGLKVNKTSSAAGDSVPSRGRSVSYETVQEIRKAYSVGRYDNPGEPRSASAIAEEFGVSASGVNHYVNYQQHKLRRGDTAYTPLLNEFYNAESGFENGAPFFEEGIKETAERYTPVSKRVNKVAVA